MFHRYQLYLSTLTETPEATDGPLRTALRSGCMVDKGRFTIMHCDCVRVQFVHEHVDELLCMILRYGPNISKDL